jgi:hypothetical protein
MLVIYISTFIRLYYVVPLSGNSLSGKPFFKARANGRFEMLGEPQRDLTPEQAATKLRDVKDTHYSLR